MKLSLKQLQDLTTKLDNLDLLADEVTEINFSLLHLNVVSFKLKGEVKFYRFQNNQWEYTTREQIQFNS